MRKPLISTYKLKLRFFEIEVDEEVVGFLFFGDLVGVLDQVGCFDFLDEVLDFMLFEVFFEEDDAFAAYSIAVAVF